MNNSQLRAGAAQTNITPQVGVQLAGSLLGIISTHIQDSLQARAIVLRRKLKTAGQQEFPAIISQ